jgi:hypothetical protein
MAWNYEEKSTKKYSFEDSLSWVKSNMPQNIKSAVIYKEEDRTEEGIIKLHICFLDDEQNPLLNGEYPHLSVFTSEIDNELRNSFGDKSLIILK